jgi:hypothetical protein
LRLVVAERLEGQADLLVRALEQAADLGRRHVPILVLVQVRRRPCGLEHVALDALDLDLHAIGRRRAQPEHGRRAAQDAQRDTSACGAAHAVSAFDVIERGRLTPTLVPWRVLATPTQPCGRLRVAF